MGCNYQRVPEHGAIIRIYIMHLYFLFAASQLTCATPTLETKFSFELEDLDNNVPPSPTKITVTGPGNQDDNDGLVPEMSRLDMLSSSSHSAESGYSSNVSGDNVTKALSSEELELSSHVTNIHISGKGDSQVSYQQQHTFQEKTVTQECDNSRRLYIRGQGHRSPTKDHSSQTVVKLTGSHERETYRDDMFIQSGSEHDTDDVVFVDNPLYSATNKLCSVPTNLEDKPVHEFKNSHITSPKKVKDIVSEMNKSISEESASDLNETHSRKSPVKVAPKPAERNSSGKRQGFADETLVDDSDYVDVVIVKSPGSNDLHKSSVQEQSGYVCSYAEAGSPTKSSPVHPGPSGNCYVDPNAVGSPLQAAPRKFLTALQQNEHSTGSTGAKPKTTYNAPPGGKKLLGKVPPKPPRKPKPSTKVLNQGYEVIEVQPIVGTYELVTVQNISTRRVPGSASHESAEEGNKYCPVDYRRQEGGSSGSPAADVYAVVESKPRRASISQEVGILLS